jgi:hypothetical protein
MNAKQRREYWKKVERLRLQMDNKYSSLFSDAIRKDILQFSKDIVNYGAGGARSMLGSYAWNEDILSVMGKMYKEIAVLFGNAVFRAIGVMNTKAMNSENTTEWIKEVNDFLMKYGFLLVSNITQTTKARLQEIVSRGMDEGKSIDEIVKEVLHDDIMYSEMRARRIVRTEVMRASNYAAVMAAQSHNFYVDKIWISSHDGRTRRIPKDQYDHWFMDGKQVAWEDDFQSRDKKGNLVLAGFPGDPTSPPGFSINCRCAVGFVGRRDENGNLILKK